MLVIRCKSCGKQLESQANKTISCGCSNMTTIRGDKISAVDLSQVVVVNSAVSVKKKGFLTTEDIAWQEARKQRKVRKLDFEIR